ncbi:membrane protein [Rugosimonospora africana]|uniref:Membrane protein n=1 Tax=Rugosimonospora africana TaxID=556532 RepID=A0A8J3QW91_9ACTN|nr:membrane protein [Rugosimonospora africana]
MDGPIPPDRPIARWVLISAALCSIVLTTGWLIADAVQPATYSPIHQTISILAGHAGAHRWIATTALLLVGACYLATAAGMTALRLPGRIGLAVAGTAAIGVAMCPEPVVGTTTQHMAFTTVGAATIAIWPALTARRDHGGCAVLSVPVAATVTVAFLALLAWLFIEAQTDGRVGLAERIDSSVQACWPFVVAVGLRRSARTAPARPVPEDASPAEVG